MKNPWVIIGIITVILFGGVIFLSNVSTEENDEIHNEGVELIQHIKGNSEAAVTLVEYSDFQCPACAAFQAPLSGVLNIYKDNINFEYKHFPLPMHSYAQQAAVAAEAAGQQGKFFEFHDLLFENQQTWADSPIPNSLFIKYAEELGLDIDLFRKHLKSSILLDKVKTDLAEGKRLKVTGTPTFFLNGEKMEIETYQKFVEQIAFAINPGSASTTVNGETPSPAAGVRFGI
ncbi:MAG: protein-disulfide isomerase [Candidatus Paceibacteria bacterium]|jgi:protein-disulfide isomerase